MFRISKVKVSLRMDLLAPFEQEKLRKLIRQFPEVPLLHIDNFSLAFWKVKLDHYRKVAFPDNWCEVTKYMSSGAVN